MVEVGPNNVRRDRGTLTARLAGNDAASLRAALNALTQQANAQIQDEWKARAGSPAVVNNNQTRSRISATALYANERQWEQIKDALEGAAGTVISEIRIEAVGREGALVSFVFAGDRVRAWRRSQPPRRQPGRHSPAGRCSAPRDDDILAVMRQPRLFEFNMGERSPDTLVVTRANEDAARLLTEWKTWPGGALALIGPQGSGKTPLALAWAVEAGARELSAAAPPEEAAALYGESRKAGFWSMTPTGRAIRPCSGGCWI